jgi:hypothetical protein
MKIGVNLNINVQKIDKARLYSGKKGKYLSLVTFIDTENTGQYGDHGTVSQGKKKDEDVKMPIIGNAKIFWRDDNSDNRDAMPKADVTPDDCGIPF